MINLHKMLFSSTLMLGTLLTISSYSWVGMWMGLEINLLSIIPLMNSPKSQLASESSLKYFIIQTIASSILLYSLILMSSIEMKETLLPVSTFINLALLLKMGAAPLHFWFPEIMEGLSWMNSLIMMTWQKIAPLVILMNIPKQINLLYMAILASLAIGGLLGINQSSLRKILAYSSINHVGWMLSAMLTNSSIWLNYFLIYTFISLNLILVLKTFNIFYTKQIFNQKKNLLKISFLMNLLSMGGIPPFLGFLPKWMVLSTMSKNNPTLSLMMVVLTLVTLFLYMRTIMPSITLINTENKMKSNPKPKFIIWWTNGMNLLTLTLCTLWFNLT